MSGTVIASAFGLVAIVFIGVGAALLRWAPPPSAAWGAAFHVVWLPAAAEALVVTLFAALWFGSLGSGGWVVLFLLVGALAGGADRWTRRRLAGGHAREDLKLLTVTLLKYVVAGGLCAWLLT